MYGVLTGTMRLVTRTYLGSRFHIEGEEFVPKTGPVLFVSNHIGTIDPPLTGAFIPRKDLSYMAKEEYFSNPPMRLLFSSYRAFPVTRGTADRKALTTAIGILKRGEALLVYPEGTRSPDAAIQEPKAGVGHILKRAPAPVIPVAIFGSENVLRKHEFFPKRADVTVRFGPPVADVLVARDGTPRTQTEISTLTMYSVAELLPGSYRGIYQGKTLDEALADAKARHKHRDADG